MNFEFHPEAHDEYETAARRYAAIQPELAQRFADRIETAVSALAEQPLRFAVFEHDVRRCLVRVFPYAVLFTIEVDYVLIVAVMHCHRKPGYWRHRMVSDI